MTTSELALRLALPMRRIVLIAALLGLAFFLRDHLLSAAVFSVVSLWHISPTVLVGVLVTAVLTATGSIGLLVATFDAREFSGILLVSLVGAFLPVCGITLLPLVAGLLGAGMALAPVMAFLLSSAVTDPAMFAVTAATLGLPFAMGKTAAAFGIGVLGGGITWGLVQFGWFERPMRQSSMLKSLVPESASRTLTGTDVHWRFWDDSERVALFRATVGSMARLVVMFLTIAFAAEYFLTLFLPDGALASIVGQDSRLAIPIAAIVAAPLYLDGYAALPLVRGLMDLGMAQGAAMAFLIAGGIISAWTAIPVFALVRLPVFLAYVAMAIAGSMLAGWAYSGVMA